MNFKGMFSVPLLEITRCKYIKRMLTESVEFGPSCGLMRGSFKLQRYLRQTSKNMK